MASNILNQIGKKLQEVGGRIGSGVQNFMTDLPANSAYVQALISQRIAPREKLPTAEMASNRNFGPMDELRENLNYLPVKSMSAQLRPVMEVPNTPYNQALEQQKQEILKSGLYRPAMARYLSTVPVYGNYENPGSGFTPLSIYDSYNASSRDPMVTETRNLPWEDYTAPSPSIQIGITKDQTNFGTSVPSEYPQLNSVMAHELAHNAPRNPAQKESFIEFFNNINEKEQPLLYNAGLTYMRNGQMPPNAEEFYATIVQNMGPKVLQIPEVRSFFQNIFK